VSVFRTLIIAFALRFFIFSHNLYSNAVCLTITEGCYLLYLSRLVSLCTQANCADKWASCLPILSTRGQRTDMTLKWHDLTSFIEVYRRQGHGDADDGKLNAIAGSWFLITKVTLFYVRIIRSIVLFTKLRRA